MPIYEYFCPDNNRIYQFFAKTLAQGQSLPKCPDNPAFRMERIMSAFAITGRSGSEEKKPADGPPGDAAAAGPGGEPDDPRMDAAFEQLESEMGEVDENDPRAMGRMMRRMAELSGEKLDEPMEEVVRKLEEGTDPEELESAMGGAFPEDGAGPGEDGMGGLGGFGGGSPTRDPHLYDY